MLFRSVKKKVKIEKMVQQSANLGAFISSLYSEDFDLMSRSVVDEIVEPDRSMLIPEFESIKKISTESGALSCGISGSGPSIFALSNNSETSKIILNNICSHLDKVRIDYDSFISKVNPKGIKILD